MDFTVYLHHRYVVIIAHIIEFIVRNYWNHITFEFTSIWVVCVGENAYVIGWQQNTVNICEVLTLLCVWGNWLIKFFLKIKNVTVFPNSPTFQKWWNHEGELKVFRSITINIRKICWKLFSSLKKLFLFIRQKIKKIRIRVSTLLPSERRDLVLLDPFFIWES